MVFAECTVVRISESHARPPAESRNDRNSYRPVSAVHDVLNIVELEHDISDQT
jgi:hypothetical protein